ncbi:MAG: hypothetical protein AMS26_18950 [Bacteroides sp. SM23_62]|nr:MAG: hypothetical protein AMS26_18950 [Bacteroides sp. SM23_62]
MAFLNKDQIDFIRNDLKKRTLSRSFLFNEWVDHVCCDVETMMNRGLSFEDAYGQISRERSDIDISTAHRDVQQFLNHRYVGIKKLLLFAFLLFAASWIINLLGIGSWIGLVAFIILGTVYLRIAIDFLRKRHIRKGNTWLSVLAGLSFVGTLSGILLIFLSRNFGFSTRGHGVDLTVFGWFFFSLLCLIYYMGEFKSAIEPVEIRKMRWLGCLSGFNLLLAAVSIATFPLYHLVKNYLFFLILFILGFDLLVLVILLLTRSMKNTLAVSLILGSFMIVFIHSHFRTKLPGGKPKLYELTLQVSPDPSWSSDRIYISMYYENFADRPITLPLMKMDDNLFGITMPSYAYRGYLFYGIATDSTGAVEYFRSASSIDSVLLKIPNKKIYQLQ